MKLLDEAQTCIDSILASFNRSPYFFEFKLYFVQMFFKFFKYKHADYLLKTLEEKVEEDVAYNFVSHNVNPLKCLMLIIDVVHKVKDAYPIVYLRCQMVTEPVEKMAKAIIDSFPSPDELKIVLKQKDLYGQDLLWYIAEHNIYSILDAKVMDRIL